MHRVISIIRRFALGIREWHLSAAVVVIVFLYVMGYAYDWLANARELLGSQKFSLETLPLAQFGVTVFGLFSILLVFLQLRFTARWNKRMSYHQHFSEVPRPGKVAAWRKHAKRLGVVLSSTTSNSPLSSEISTKIFNDELANHAVSQYLDDFEEMCSAINSGILDDSYAYSIEATRVIRTFFLFQPFINLARASVPGAAFYNELENVAYRWERKKIVEIDETKLTKSKLATGIRDAV